MRFAQKMSEVSMATHQQNSDLLNLGFLGSWSSSGVVGGGLRLLGTLWLHPSAWKHFLSGVAPGLRPDFALVDLKLEHWRNPGIQRILVQLHATAPVLIAVVTAILCMAAGASAATTFWGVVYGLALSLAGTLIVELLISVPSALSGAMVIGPAFGFAFGAAIEKAGGLGPLESAFSRTGFVDGVALGVTGVVNASPGVGLLVSLAIGISGYLAGAIASGRASAEFARQMGGILTGVVISGLAYGLTIGLPLYFVVRVMNLWQLAVFFGLMTGATVLAAIRLRTGYWKASFCWGAVMCILMLFAVVAARGQVLEAGASVLLSGIPKGFLYSAAFGLAFALACRVAGPWSGAVASALGSGGCYIVLRILMRPDTPWIALPASLLVMSVGLALPRWLPLFLYPIEAVWNHVILRLDERRKERSGRLLFRNSVFWDEHQRLPLRGLEDHLLLLMERDSAAGRKAIGRVLASPQRWAARAVQVELDALRLERCTSAKLIADLTREFISADLSQSDSVNNVLRRFLAASQEVRVALNQTNRYNERALLLSVQRRLDELAQDIVRSTDRKLPRFHPIALQWMRVLSTHVNELDREIELRQEIASPYVVGLPLTEEQDVFVGRSDISSRIEQLLLGNNRAPLLLYGQRRMGKTSLLNNLGRLLPDSIVPFFVDLQGPSTKTDSAGFFFNLIGAMASSAKRYRGLILLQPTRDEVERDPFTCFDEWLSHTETMLRGRVGLLALDEFEALNIAFQKSRLDESDILGMLRHLIQHRLEVKILLAGSHTLDELQCWATYLINVQTIHVSYLSAEETRQLVERPVKDFPLRYASNATEQVLKLTRGHPHLVQLLCHHIVLLKNSQPQAARLTVTAGDVEAAVPEALSSGSLFFGDIANQAREQGIRILRRLASYGEDGPVQAGLLAGGNLDIRATIDNLVRREVLERADGGYRFSIELVRRWFCSRANPWLDSYENEAVAPNQPIQGIK